MRQHHVTESLANIRHIEEGLLQDIGIEDVRGRLLKIGLPVSEAEIPCTNELKEYLKQASKALGNYNKGLAEETTQFTQH